MSKVKKETIEAKGFAIQIYTEDFQNDYISLTDIARYKSDEPSDVIKNWMRRKDTIEFLGLWESLNNMNFNSVEFDRIKSEAGYNSFTLSPKKWVEKTDAIKEYLLKDLTNEQLSYKYASEADMLNVALFNKRAKQWREENPELKGNMRDYASLNELLVLANMESYNAILIGKGMDQKERMIELRKLARNQLMSIEKLNNTGIKSLEDNSKK
ncbi:TPA: KilA-N domain-containing protein [Streptococcus agalactiae]|nr:KilA-N domain-containing protein [Streptococcus agalactiae]HEO4306003.1 KilA-N domain-containing protein [Streptococcus agalactiae]